jgi:transposase
MLEFHGLDEGLLPGSWSKAMYTRLKLHLKYLTISRSLRFSFKVMLNELEYLRGIRKEIVLQLRTLAKSDRYKERVELLQSAPGIGMFTAIRLILEWGDVSRFTRKEEFASFLGLVPSDYSSGEQERQGHITRQGNSSVRSWLVE